MNDAPQTDRETTSMQCDHWHRSLRYAPRDRSIIDKVRESPVTFFISLGLLCFLLVAMGLLAIGVIQ